VFSATNPTVHIRLRQKHLIEGRAVHLDAGKDLLSGLWTLDADQAHALAPSQADHYPRTDHTCSKAASQDDAGAYGGGVPKTSLVPPIKI
jgi:hypothetical protein